MKFFFLAICSIFFSLNIFSQDVASLIREADRLESLADEKAAFLKFKEVLKLQPSNLYSLCKCSELCCRVGAREKSNTKLRDDYFNTAVIYAKTAIRLYPENDDANVAMAFAVGRTILLKSGKEKVNAAKDLKVYADKAIAYNPKNFKAWSILGRWNYEVSNLSSFERGLAKIMYGGLPTGSLKNAIACYEKAKILNPAFAFNSLELAKAYHRNDQSDKAVAQLNYVLTLKNQTADDPRIKTEAQELLKKWN